MTTIRDTSAQDRPLARSAHHPLRGRRLLIGAIAVALLLWLASAALEALTGGASVSRERLNFAIVQRGDFIRDLAAEGRVVAAASPTVYAPSAGTVHLRVLAGSAVDEGTQIGFIDNPELSSQLAQDQAKLQALDVDYRRAQLDARQQAVIAQQTLDQAHIDFATAQTEHQRTQKAFELGVTAEIEVLRTDAALKKAQIALTRAQTDFDLQREGRGFDVEARRLARDQQQLRVAELQRQVDALTLRSPVAGQVGQLMIADRASVTRDTPLLSVIDLSVLEVEVSVAESFARDLTVGMPASLRGHGQRWDGQVSAVAPEVVAGEVRARVRFADAVPEGLRQNQRLSVRIVLAERRDVLSVTRGPFVAQGLGHEAYVVENNQAVRRTVRFGLSSIDKIEILEGLKAGEQVVIAGTDTFNHTERVRLTR